MKNFTRAFVLVLALTGASAAAYTNVDTFRNTNAPVTSRTSAFPIPTCPLNDPNACGIAGPAPAPSVVLK